MTAVLKNALDVLAYLVFPLPCGGCGRPAGPIFSGSFCRTCLGTLQPLAPPFCSICGLPIQVLTPMTSGPVICGPCRTAPPAYQALRAFGAYEGVLRAMIHRFKYGGIEPAGRMIGRLMADHFRCLARDQAIDWIVPVPLHRKKEKARGFNQAAYLARVLASSRCLKRPLKGVLVKTRETAPQSGLDRRARRKNVRRAFALKKQHAVRGRRILLIDDVMTTGATIEECAHVLLAGGARSVRVLTAARTLKKRGD
jgi:ComF family protein